MKKRIRLTESDLHRIVKESVNQVVNSTQERCYHTIADLEADISTVIHNTDSTSSNAFGGDDEKLKAIYNQLTHVNRDIAEQAKNTFNKLLEVISELGDIRRTLKTFNAEDKYWGHNFKKEGPEGTVGLRNYN